MRFLADMGISPRTVRRLQAAGHDAVHVAELRLHRATDPEIVRLARSENRIVITHDLDFGTIMAASGESAPSLIIFRLANMHPDKVSRYMEMIIERHSAALESGVILMVTERRVRIRRLPI